MTGVSVTVQVVRDRRSETHGRAGRPLQNKARFFRRARGWSCSLRTRLLVGARPDLSLGNSFQCRPSAVSSTRKLPSTGSPSAKQRFMSEQAKASRKNPFRLSLYCSAQVAPRQRIYKFGRLVLHRST